MDEEMAALDVPNETWDLVPLLEGKKDHWM